MDSFPRILSSLAASAIVAAMLSGSAPAFAADATAVATTATTAAATDVSAKASSKHGRRHGGMPVSHGGHLVRSAASNPGCFGVWCGRQFVLMVGIAY